MWIGLVVGFLALAIGMHAVVTRLRLPLSSVARYLVVGGGVGLLLALVTATLYGLSTTTLTVLILYALASELYIFMFTLVMSSISVSLLLRLRHGSADEAALDTRYAPSYMVDSRLAKLTTNDFLEPHGDGFRLTARGKRTVETFRRIRRTFFSSGPQA
jgi:hypothetical protein